jgi:hypothetical protein
MRDRYRGGFTQRRGGFMQPRGGFHARRFHPLDLGHLVFALESWRLDTLTLVSGSADTWTDYVGGIEFAAIGAGERPSHGGTLTPGERPALTFNGSSNWLLGPNALSSVIEAGTATRYTISMLVRPTATGARYAFTKSTAVAPTSNLQFGQRGIDGGSRLSSQVAGLGHHGDVNHLNQWAAASWVIDPSESAQIDRHRIYGGGERQTVTRWSGNDASTGASPASATPLRIGALENTPEGTILNHWVGQIAAIYIHARVLSGPDLQQVGQYMGAL